MIAGLKDAIIVIESPNKIAKFRGYTGAKVLATVGHFKEMPKGHISIDMRTYSPIFRIMSNKSRAVKEIKNCSGKKVYIATDPDREGYAIGTNVYGLVKNSAAKVYRVEVHEITEKGIVEALQKAKEFDQTNTSMYDAFLGRRVGDRLIGYILSPEVTNQLNDGDTYSVGRVQSPALHMVVDREREIRRFVPEPFYQVELKLKLDGVEFSAIHKAGNMPSKDDARLVMESLATARSPARVMDVEQTMQQRAPKPPYTTSTLCQAANNRLGLSTEETMNLAQGLFERGLITYHRTDSVRITVEMINAIQAFVRKQYGLEYCPDHPYIYLSKDSQADAHEAIRPTAIHPIEECEKLALGNGLTDQHAGLYKLIVGRTIASQMAPARSELTKARLDYGGQVFLAQGTVQIFAGHGKVYEDLGKDKDAGEAMPELSAGQEIDVIKLLLLEKETKSPARYSEATLVKELEKQGIGRPSTFATILETLKKRNYFKLQKKFLVPTGKGEKLIDLLSAKFPWVINYQFTREMEEYLDKVANGKANWRDFARSLHSKMNFMEPPVWKRAAG